MIDGRTAINTVSELALPALFTYAGTALFTSINPTAGAIVGLTAAVVHKFVKPWFHKFFSAPGANESSKTLGQIVSIGASIAIPVVVANWAGFAIAINDAAKMWLATVGAFFITSLFIPAVSNRDVRVLPF